MSDLIIEFYSQEIPARFQDMAAQELKRIFEEQFQNLNLLAEIECFSTLYRLTIYIRNLPGDLPNIKVQKKGPKVSADRKAIEGFIRSNSTSLESLVIQEVDGENFYFHIEEKQGEKISNLFPTVFQNVISRFQWPKSMRWGEHEIRWIRPLRNILCLFGEEIIELSFGHLRSNNLTFFQSEVVRLKDANDYFRFLKEKNIILEKGLREKKILELMEDLALKSDIILKKDPALLEEVAGLIEVPKALLGKIDESFMHLPGEVLELVMKIHQKYFSILDHEGRITNKFIFITIDKATANYDLIVRGNEKVLTNRLKDAEFFYAQDNKKALSEYVENLKSVTFESELGNYYNKVLRIRSLSEELCNILSIKNQEEILRAAYLCKADLVTKMVGELPELQGVMGSYYALNSEEFQGTAKIIREHYQPIGQDDIIPTDGSAIVALADKIDSVVGMFLVGNQPKGSKDPYAVRRSVLGIIKIIIENRFNLDLLNLIRLSITLYRGQGLVIMNLSDLEEKIIKFFFDRFNNLLRSEEYAYDLIEAVLAVDLRLNLYEDLLKIQALKSYFTSYDHEVAYSLRRVYNIIRNNNLSVNLHPNLLEELAEKELYKSLTLLESQFNNKTDFNNISMDSFVGKIKLLNSLKDPIERFFDQIMVKVEDKKIRNNRLALLISIKDLTQQIADFSKLVMTKEDSI